MKQGNGIRAALAAAMTVSLMGGSALGEVAGPGVPGNVVTATTAASGTAAPVLLPNQAFSIDRFRGMRIGDRVSLDRVRLDEDRVVDLELERFEILSETAEVIEVGAAGERVMERPDVVLLRGVVRGQPESRVFIGLGGESEGLPVHGFVQAMDGGPAAVYVVSTGAFVGDELGGSGGMVEVVDPESLVALMNDRPMQADGGNGFCNSESVPQPFAQILEGLGGNTPAARGSAPCRVASVAIDTDWAFTDRLFSRNTTASAAYALTLMAASSEIYRRDVNVRFEVPYLRVWADSNDPWSASSSGDMLSQFRAHWRSEQGGVSRNLAHLFSGANLGGGVAYVGTLCSSQNGYAVSGNLNGSFPMPVRDNSNSNWDLMVVSHELGHNFGSGHTHSAYTPPVDGCGNGDCGSSFDTTIMSYCHLCPGGLSNMDMRFHPRVIDRILTYLDTACNIEIDGVSAATDRVSIFQGGKIDIDVTVNDATADCGTPTLLGFDPVSANGGTISLSTETAADGSPLISYVAPIDFAGVDTFAYTLVEGGAGMVEVTIEPLRAAVQPAAVLEGVKADFYDLDANYVNLPVFDDLEPTQSFSVPDINFEPTSGDWAGTGLTELFGAVFEGYINVPADGIWTLSIESDDGSRLFYGFGEDREQVVSNNGLHGMVDRSGDLPLRAGLHPFRIEYFENSGSAGLIFRMEGPDTARMVVPASRLSSAYDCTADFNGDFNVNVLDVIAFITAWQANEPAADIAEGDGGFTIFDVISFIEIFNLGCDQ